MLKNTEAGPISKKVRADLKKFKNQKVIDFADIKNVKIYAENLDKSVISQAEMEELDPLHAIYANAQNRISVLIEQLGELPAFEKLNNAYTDAHELYLPSGPPMSPLTLSYFSSWGAFDLCVGLKKETFGTVIIDLCKSLNVAPEMIQIFECMQNSRMGFYIHKGVYGKFVLLEELITKKQIKVVVPSGYFGKTGQIWFARVMPEPFPNLNHGYSVVFTTPYVITEKIGEMLCFCREESLLAFFDRTQEKTGINDKIKSYEKLMKYGISRNYWNEYIFEGYVNYEHDWILLAGFPDIALSRPHSRQSEKKMGDC